MIAGFALMFFVMMNGLYYINVVINKGDLTVAGNFNNMIGINMNRDSNDNMQKKEFEQTVTEDGKKIIEYMHSLDYTVMTNISANVKGYASTQSAWVVINQADDFNRKLEWGQYPTKDEYKNEHVALVGSAIDDVAYERDGKRYIVMNGIEYRIVGVFYDTSLMGDDYSLLIYYDSHTSNELKTLNKSLVNIWMNNICMSDTLTKEEMFDDMNTYIKENIYNFYSTRNEVKETFTRNTYIVEIEKLLSKILFAFACINSIVISSLWFKKRMKEFAIRNAFGYGKIRLAVMIIGNLTGLMIVAFVLAILVQYGYCMVIGRELRVAMLLQYLLYSVATTVGILLVSMIVNMGKIISIYPSTMIRQSEDE